ncbi:MAG: hypothetical protein AAF702_21580 [Chloroflexota bacterium]
MNIATVTCINPNEYVPWELEAYADGEEVPHVQEHLARCSSCQAKLDGMRYIDLALTKELYRFDCYPWETLRRYCWNELAEREEDDIKHHLAICPLCTADVAAIKASSVEKKQPTTSDAEPSLIERITETVDEYTGNIRMVVATLLNSQPPLATAAAFRGESDQSSLLYQVDELMVSLMLKPDMSGTKTVSGQVLADSINKDATFQLIPDKDGEATVDGGIDESGLFTATNIRAGIYQLVLKFNAQVVLIPDVAISAA